MSTERSKEAEPRPNRCGMCKFWAKSGTWEKSAHFKYGPSGYKGHCPFRLEQVPDYAWCVKFQKISFWRRCLQLLAR